MAARTVKYASKAPGSAAQGTVVPVVEALPEEMVSRCIVDVRVQLTPTDLAAIMPGDDIQDITPFIAVIENKAKAQLEGKCCQHGYVRPGTVRLLNHGVPTATHGRFTGDMISRARVECEVINVPENMEVEAVVLQSNRVGMYVHIGGVLQIQIPRDYHLIPPERRHPEAKRLKHGGAIDVFEMTRIGDRVRVRILRTRFHQNESVISGVAELMVLVEKGPAWDEGAVVENPYERATGTLRGAVALPALAASIVAAEENGEGENEDNGGEDEARNEEAAE